MFFLIPHWENLADKHQGEAKEEAEIRFKLVSEAYEILKDTKTRDIFDQFGMDGLKASSRADRAQQRGGSRPSAGFPHHHPFGPGGFHFRRPEDIFREAFGAHFSMFSGPHMGHPFMNGPGGHPFANDPFFSGGPFFNAGPSPGMMFGGAPFMHGHMMPMAPAMPRMMNPMMNPMADMMSSANGNGFSKSFSFSSSSSSGGRGGTTSHSTSTTVENGKRVTRTKSVDPEGRVTEEVVSVSPDGSTVREVKVNGKRTEYQEQSRHSITGGFQ
jgi:DnaJ-class molecular chaperone